MIKYLHYSVYNIISSRLKLFSFKNMIDRTDGPVAFQSRAPCVCEHSALCRASILPIAKHFRLSTRDSLYSQDPFAFALFNSECNFPSDRSPLIFLDCAVGLRQFASHVLADRDTERITSDSKEFRKFPTLRNSVALVYVRRT